MIIPNLFFFTFVVLLFLHLAIFLMLFITCFDHKACVASHACWNAHCHAVAGVVSKSYYRSVARGASRDSIIYTPLMNSLVSCDYIHARHVVANHSRDQMKGHCRETESSAGQSVQCKHEVAMRAFADY